MRKNIHKAAYTQEWLPILKHKELNKHTPEGRKGHGKYINIQENLPKLGEKDKQLRSSPFYPSAPRRGNSTEVQPIAWLSLPDSYQP